MCVNSLSADELTLRETDAIIVTMDIPHRYITMGRKSVFSRAAGISLSDLHRVMEYLSLKYPESALLK